MKLLKEIHADVSSTIKWTHHNDSKTATFVDNTNILHELRFTPISDTTWSVLLERNFNTSMHTYSTVFSAFSQMFEHLDLFELIIHSNRLNEKETMQVIKEIKHIYDYNVHSTNDGLYELCRGIENSSAEILTEEPNTSLMYHKLFPNKRLLRDLESRGYKFQMGNGLKIYKQHYASVHRGSGPSKRRTLQSVVILKDGKIFRKIPKSKWVQLADVSDQNSVSWGTLFMKKMMARENENIKKRKAKLAQHRKDRLNKVA